MECCPCNFIYNVLRQWAMDEIIEYYADGLLQSRFKMDKQPKKEKIQKLEKRLENRQFTLYEALQEDIAVDWFKMGHPAFLAMLGSRGFAEMISYVVEVGPPDNRMRSYKIPMITTQIMCCPMPKVFELFFMQDEDRKGEILLARLLQYFDGTPNYVLSGYIVKILMNLMVGNAPRVLEYLFKNGKIMKMPLFLQSVSIADFLLRIVVVEDLLLNNKIKERIELFHIIVDIYGDNREPPEILENANYFLTESIVRLWSHKHKELGRFSTEIFRVVEMIIDKSNLHQQENLMIVVMKHLTSYADEAPFLIIALFKKINRELSTALQSTETLKLQFKEMVPRFSIKRLKLLQAMSSMFLNVPQIMVKQLKTTNVFIYLLEFVTKYEWNNIVQAEIQKIFKLALGPPVRHQPKPNETVQKNPQRHADTLYQILFLQANVPSKLREMIKRESEKHKRGCGYSGFLISLTKYITNIVKEGTLMGQLIQKNQKDMLETFEYFLKAKENNETVSDGFQVVHNVAKPRFNLGTIVEEYRVFFDQIETINKKYQIERPASQHKDLGQEMIHEIENENELVYKLLTESNEEKKSENLTESVQ